MFPIMKGRPTFPQYFGHRVGMMGYVDDAGGGIPASLVQLLDGYVVSGYRLFHRIVATPLEIRKACF